MSAPQLDCQPDKVRDCGPIYHPALCPRREALLSQKTVVQHGAPSLIGNDKLVLIQALC